MKKYVIMFECKTYVNEEIDGTNFGLADDTAYDTFEEAYTVLSDTILPDTIKSINEGYLDDYEEEELDDVRTLEVGLIPLDRLPLDRAEAVDIIAYVDVYNPRYGERLEENNYKILPVLIR